MTLEIKISLNITPADYSAQVAEANTACVEVFKRINAALSSAVGEVQRQRKLHEHKLVCQTATSQVFLHLNCSGRALLGLAAKGKNWVFPDSQEFTPSAFLGLRAMKALIAMEATLTAQAIAGAVELLEGDEADSVITM